MACGLTPSTATEYGAQDEEELLWNLINQSSMWYFTTNKWYLSFSLQILEPRERHAREYRQMESKKESWLYYTLLVGKHGFKCGLKILLLSSKCFLQLTLAQPTQQGAPFFSWTERLVWRPCLQSRLSLALLSSVSWPHLSDVSLLPTEAKNERWWAVAQ